LEEKKKCSFVFFVFFVGSKEEEKKVLSNKERDLQFLDLFLSDAKLLLVLIRLVFGNLRSFVTHFYLLHGHTYRFESENSHRKKKKNSTFQVQVLLDFSGFFKFESKQTRQET
jgi:hypothetical protein